jgi:NAD(P)-dependent dehydrogenase (short-subunit alcohol dehydrogenase family)
MNVAELLPKQLFKGKTVFVTGGGSGINLGIGKSFAALGANIAICGRSRERLDGAAAEPAFLASPLACYMTGTVLVVDGGQNLAGSAAFARAIEAMERP